MFLFRANVGTGSAFGLVYVAAIQYSIGYPVVIAIYTHLTKSNYETCADLSTSQFDGTTSTVTQYVSCKDGTDAAFGASGTTVKYITEDPYTTWYTRNMATAAAQFAFNLGVYGPIASPYIA